MKTTRWLFVLGLLVLSQGVVMAQGERMLEIKPLPPKFLATLKPEALKHYEQALATYDRINYPATLDHFLDAVQADPDNIYLRFYVVKVARHMGDATAGTDSIRYYDMAIQNLKQINASPRVNRDQLKQADALMLLLTELRESVTERDEMRQRHGREIAKEYAKLAFRKSDEEEKKKKGAKGTGNLLEETTGTVTSATLMGTGDLRITTGGPDLSKLSLPSGETLKTPLAAEAATTGTAAAIAVKATIEPTTGTAEAAPIAPPPPTLTAPPAPPGPELQAAPPEGTVPDEVPLADAPGKVLPATAPKTAPAAAEPTTGTTAAAQPAAAAVPAAAVEPTTGTATTQPAAPASQPAA